MGLPDIYLQAGQLVSSLYSNFQGRRKPIPASTGLSAEVDAAAVQLAQTATRIRQQLTLVAAAVIDADLLSSAFLSLTSAMRTNRDLYLDQALLIEQYIPLKIGAPEAVFEAASKVGLAIGAAMEAFPKSRRAKPGTAARRRFEDAHATIMPAVIALCDAVAEERAKTTNVP